MGRLLKKIIPKGIFARSLIIFIVPMIMLQAIMIYIFYQRHWESVTRNIASGIAGEIAVLSQQIGRANAVEREVILQNANDLLGLRTSFDTTSPTFRKRIVLQKEYEFLRSALENKIGEPTSIIEGRENIKVIVKLKGGTLKVDFSKKRLTSPTTYIFILWMVGSSSILVIIGIIFLKNQIRPIIKLAQAAEKFGRGQEMYKFKPSGAREIRRAAVAFIAMSKRIKRQMSQRTEMLAAISHDLRSPLTRIKLQLAMLPKSEQVENLEQDVIHMEHMVESYLLFAKGEGREETAELNLSEFMKNLVETFARQNHTLKVSGEFEGISIEARKNALFRAFSNLIDNAFAHAQKVQVGVEAAENELVINVDDDGPGIPEEKRSEVFKAFYRLDKARTPTKVGVGLGLTIARDIILGHGGDIDLEQSPLGGLRVRVLLPLAHRVV